MTRSTSSVIFVLALLGSVITNSFVRDPYCEVDKEPVLKVEYEAEDHMVCKDPKALNLQPSVPWGINKSVLYQTISKKRRQDTGKCVVESGLANGIFTLNNVDINNLELDFPDHTYSINIVERNGSVRGSLRGYVDEVGSYAYTKKEYAQYERMEVLPNYDCAVIPPLEHDPSKMKICVSEIQNMRIVLYWEFIDIASKHLNWYKATSIEWVCAGKELFEPPSDVELVRLGM